MSKYTATFKERVVREYQPGVRGQGFQALAQRFKVGKVGPSAKLIKIWWEKWNTGGRTLESFGDREVL